MTVEFEKPARASAGFRIWQSSKARSAHKATISDLNRPLTKSAAEINNIITVINIFLQKKRITKIGNLKNLLLRVQKKHKKSHLLESLFYFCQMIKAIVSSIADL
jgi:hypothetical protein